MLAMLVLGGCGEQESSPSAERQDQKGASTARASWGATPPATGVVGDGGINGVHGKASAGGTGVFGEGAGGYAGAFSGGKAQLRIVPKAGVGRPTSGSFGKGDVYMDSAANLFVCVAGGTPGTWRQVSTVAVS
jgi:hypothetical protein